MPLTSIRSIHLILQLIFIKVNFASSKAALGIDIDATMHKTHWMLHRIRKGERFVGATRRPKAFITDGVYLAKNIGRRR